MPDYPLLVLGCDPGVSGGLAFLGDVFEFCEAYPMPETRRDLLEILEERSSHIVLAVVELVRSSPQMGVTSAFTFGMNYERLLMALTATRIPLSEVRPAMWQRTFTLKKGKGLGLSATEKKRDHRRLAQELFPQIKVTLSTCDALLIAEWARRQRSSRG